MLEVGGKYGAARYLTKSGRHWIETKIIKSRWRNTSLVEAGDIDQNRS